MLAEMPLNDCKCKHKLSTHKQTFRRMSFDLLRLHGLPSTIYLLAKMLFYEIRSFPRCGHDKFAQLNGIYIFKCMSIHIDIYWCVYYLLLCVGSRANDRQILCCKTHKLCTYI